jgi:hypothetical protein
VQESEPEAPDVLAGQETHSSVTVVIPVQDAVVAPPVTVHPVMTELEVVVQPAGDGVIVAQETKKLVEV